MILDKEKELIRDALKDLSKVNNIEESLGTPVSSIQQLPQDFHSYGKTDAEGKHWRIKGNRVPINSSHDVCAHYSIMNHYNHSIAASPINSESLALAYGNRSVILEHIHRHKESITAIDRAIKITRIPYLMVELLCRKAKCMAYLGSPAAVEENLRMASSWLNKIRPKDTVKQIMVVTVHDVEVLVKHLVRTIPDANHEIEEVEELLLSTKVESKNSVKLVHSEKYGRHLIAVEDIKPGEILLAEKTLNSPPGVSQKYLYCWHCNSFLWDIVPCLYCLNCCFCSEKCRTESWEMYHELECKFFLLYTLHYAELSTLCEPYITIVNPLSSHLGLRIFMTALLKAGDVNSLKASLESLDAHPDQDEQLKNLPSDHYRHVYVLSDNIRTDYLKGVVWDCALQLVVFAKFTSLFGETFNSSNFSLSRMINDDDHLLMGALLLRFCTVIHAHGLENKRNHDCKKENSCEAPDCGLISWSVGTNSSFTRQSCVPNSARCMIESNKMILYSIMPIQKGSLILESETSIFSNLPNLKRKEHFQERYGICCTCQACVEDWPYVDYEIPFCREYFSKVASTTSGVSSKTLKELDSLWDVYDNLSLRKILSKFSVLIQSLSEESPLPSTLTVLTIRNLMILVNSTQSYFNKQQLRKSV